MEAYDYREVMKNDILEYIEYNITAKEEEEEEKC